MSDDLKSHLLEHVWPELLRVNGSRPDAVRTVMVDRRKLNESIKAAFKMLDPEKPA